MNDRPITAHNVVAERLLRASDTLTSIAPITDADKDFGLGEAYGVSARIMEKRIVRGEKPLGWKIGFTNVTIWDEYDVHAPIWGPMYTSTVETTDDPAKSISCPLDRLIEPRIEPEIVLRFWRTPDPDMDETALLACIDGIAHGFEIVHSLFPGWRFRAADTVAAFALHGCLRCGPFVRIEGHRDAWFDRLSDFSIVLSRAGVLVDRGQGSNVMGGPLSALKAFVRGLDACNPFERRIEPGDIVTTGTITRAFPVRTGERWSSMVEGLQLAGLTIAFA